MARVLAYDEYVDRIHGGWIGKCVGGTIGTPVEGVKTLMNFTADNVWPEKIPPNDDLDLQILWLQVLERTGIRLRSRDLADAWMTYCWYPFNEYGNFKRNYAKGILPPETGRFDNAFFDTGMGCPIRSEIWGFISPGNPELAAHYAGIDGSLDHGQASIEAERMLAATEADAFFVHDVEELLRRHLDRLTPGTRIRRGVDEVIASYREGLDWREARERLLARWGHLEACEAQLNIPITILALLHGRGDFGETLLIALNCGYDTDCTCATAGAILGEILGASRLPPEWVDPLDRRFVIGIDVQRPDDSIERLALDTARVGLTVARELNDRVTITGAPDYEPVPVDPPDPDLEVLPDYGDEDPCLGRTPRKLRLRLVNRTDAEVAARLTLESVARLSPAETDVTLPASGELAVEIEAALADPATAPQAIPILARLETPGGKTFESRFGLGGVWLWQVAGLYWDVKPSAPENESPSVWQHLFADLDRPYLDEENADLDAEIRRWRSILGDGSVIEAPGMTVPLEGVTGFYGEHCLYLHQKLLSPKARKAFLAFGSDAPFRAWLNGREVARLDRPGYWTPHDRPAEVELREGENRILVKLLRIRPSTRFSFGVRDGEEGRGFGGSHWLVDVSTALVE